MKIGIAMDRFSEQNRWGEEFYKKMKEFGYDCIDFQLLDTTKEIYALPQEEAEALLRKERALAEVAGMTVHQVHGPWRSPQDATEEDRAERMEKMQRSIRMAAALGAKFWIIHPIMPFGLGDRGTEQAKQTWELNLGFMRKLLETAKEVGVTICLENMPFLNFSISTPAEIAKFIREIDDENFQMCFDTGHAEAFFKEKVGVALREVGEFVRVFHIHDSRFGQDRHALPYEGIIDWADFSKALREIGFDGVFSLECEPGVKTPQPMYDTLWKTLAEIADAIANGEK